MASPTATNYSLRANSPDAAAFFLLPLREKVARTKSVPDEG
jgi:hypothetical protein